MNAVTSRRLAAALTGAVLGGLIWCGLDIFGLWGALKLGFNLSTLAGVVVIGAIVGATPLRGALWAIGGATIAALVIVCYTPLAESLTRPLVRADRIPPAKLDAVVVLSGGSTGDNLMGPQSLDRLLKGMELAETGRASELILSRETWERGGRMISDAGDQKRVLALGAVPVPVRFIDSVYSTHDEAVRLRALEGTKEWKRIGLVTSPLHSRRACETFEKAGFTVTCIPSASRDRSIWNLDTSGDRLLAFKGWLYETAGTINYRWKGWI